MRDRLGHRQPTVPLGGWWFANLPHGLSRRVVASHSATTSCHSLLVALQRRMLLRIGLGGSLVTPYSPPAYSPLNGNLAAQSPQERPRNCPCLQAQAVDPRPRHRSGGRTPLRGGCRLGHLAHFEPAAMKTRAKPRFSGRLPALPLPPATFLCRSRLTFVCGASAHPQGGICQLDPHALGKDPLPQMRALN